MGWWLWLAWSAVAADCDPSGALDDAEQLVLEARLDQARDALRDAEKAMTCGSTASPQTLGRAWLIEAAVETFAGDRGAAATAFVAANRVAPDLWLPSLGAPLKEAYDAVVADHQALDGSVELLGQPEGAWIAVDGAEAQAAADVGAGLHLVQVGRSADDIRWARVVLVPPDQQVSLRVPAFAMEDAVAPDPKPDPAVVEPTPEPAGEGGLVFAHVAAGGATVLGDALALDSGGQTFEEPAIKWMVPVEVGLTVRPGIAWIRGAVGGAPLVGGQLIYEGGAGVVGWPVAVSGHLAGGASVDVFDFGVLTGMSLPGRLEERVVAGVAIGDLPLRAELRAGANLPTERRPEPAFALLIGWDPSR